MQAEESVCMSQFSGGDLDGMSSLAVQEYLNQLLGKVSHWPSSPALVVGGSYSPATTNAWELG